MNVKNEYDLNMLMNEYDLNVKTKTNSNFAVKVTEGSNHLFLLFI